MAESIGYVRERNNDIILSIIIPTYNMDKYLGKCVDSIVSSSRGAHVEVLIVNDGSRDGSLDIAKKRAIEYPNTVKVIDKENGGHGSAINVGVAQCVGKYFRIVDADDWVDTDELDKLVDTLFDTDADCIICNYTECYEADNGMITKDMIGDIVQGIKIPIKDYVARNRLAMHSVTYNTDKYRAMNVELTENCFYVDTEFIYYPLASFDTVVCYAFNVYRYRLQREGQSISRDGFLKHIDDHRTVMLELCSFYNGFPEDRREAKRYLAYEIGNHLSYQQAFLINENLRKQEWHDYKKFIKKVKKLCLPAYRAMSLKRRIAVHLGAGFVKSWAKKRFGK